jgi:transposase InsO family protein
MAIRHRSGTSNVAVDALSRMYMGRECTTEDGSTCMVCEDWEVSRGIVNNLFGIHIDEVTSSLCDRFTDEPLFLEVVQAITNCDGHRNERECSRAQHRAEGYQIEDGKLWHITDGKLIRAKPRLECVSQNEAIKLAKHEHSNNGHWGRDLTKLQLMDRIYSPHLDQSVTIALLQCPQCKNFGSSHLHALMYPIMRQYPFELLIADYLSLPKGKGVYHTVLLILDTYSRFTWGFKFKSSGMAKTTLYGLNAITHTFHPPETLMTDGGSHFNNGDVRAWCEAKGTSHQVMVVYAPWINGLIENANGKLLGQLKQLCSPGLGEDDYENVKPENITRAWPDHFDIAIQQLNKCIIPSLQFSPKELLFSFIVNTTHTPSMISTIAPTQSDITAQMAYIDQQKGANQVISIREEGANGAEQPTGLRRDRTECQEEVEQV